MEDTKLDNQQDKNEEQAEPTKTPGLFQTIFRYSDAKDMLFMALGTFGCLADGSSTPLIMLVLSKIMNKYAISKSFTLHDINQVNPNSKCKFIVFKILIFNFLTHVIAFRYICICRIP